MTVQLVPTRAVYAVGEPVVVEVRDLESSARVRVLHLGEPLAEVDCVGNGELSLGTLPPGGYGVELVVDAGVAARTAVEVRGSTGGAMRYGFVASYLPGRDTAPVADNVRRLHLTDVQFYDWAYRHADLLGGGEQYADALDQPIALATVRDLVAAVHRAGARALGYAAVYGVGNAEWPTWADAALLQPSGAPYSLGDFLQLVDPADPRWLAHFLADLTAASALGFDGFHLDQYGYPKYAVRSDGRHVTVEDSFATLITQAREALPDARLVFNNVNDFPTWRTGSTPQDAMYVEVWPPHTTLGHLADVATRARAAGGGKPVVIAAYQHVYDHAPADEADRATAFTMATLFSHGATQLLAGEGDRILVDPYYVRNHVVEHSTAQLLLRWYDFAVEHTELLFDDALVDMTGALAGPYNGDLDVAYPAVSLSESAAAGTVWRRVVGHGGRLVVHLVNLTDQSDTEWDAPRKPVQPVAGGQLRVRRVGDAVPRVRVADPDAIAALRDLPVVVDGEHAVCDLPPLHVWQLLSIELVPAADHVEESR